MPAPDLHARWAAAQAYGERHPATFGGLGHFFDDVLPAFFTADLDRHREGLAAEVGSAGAVEVRPCRYPRAQVESWSDEIEAWVGADEERRRLLDVHHAGMDVTPEGWVPAVLIGPCSAWRATEIRRALAPVPVRVCWTNADRQALGPVAARAFEAERDRLRGTFETAAAYGAAHPDDFGGLCWDDDAAPTPRVAVSFARGVAAHGAALAAAVEHPGALEVRAGAHPVRQVGLETFFRTCELTVHPPPDEPGGLGERGPA